MRYWVFLAYLSVYLAWSSSRDAESNVAFLKADANFGPLYATRLVLSRTLSCIRLGCHSTSAISHRCLTSYHGLGNPVFMNSNAFNATSPS
jgi:hypothetical protein